MTIAIERTFHAPIEDVWELWTTKAGIEAWWGPPGFTVEVLDLDLRPGGTMRYAMSAAGPEQIAYMKRAGMPTTTVTSVEFLEIVPHRRLAYDNVVDFIPGVAPYRASMMVELRPIDGGVHMVVTVGEMHDATWTQRAVMGWEGELGKLAALLANRAVA